MTLQICSQCQQTYLSSDIECPHCIIIKPTASIMPLAILLGIGLTGCIEKGGEAMYGVPVYDMDEDGFDDYIDCDDNDANTYPGAAPQDSEEECMTDADGDGYGSDSPAETGMGIAAGTDCDDNDPNIFPEAEEIAGDGVDQNCNGNDDD